MSVMTPCALALVRTSKPHALSLVLAPLPRALVLVHIAPPSLPPSWISAIIVRSWSLIIMSPPSWILAFIVCNWSSVIIVTFILAMTCSTLSSSLHAFGFTVYC